MYVETRKRENVIYRFYYFVKHTHTHTHTHKLTKTLRRQFSQNTRSVRRIPHCEMEWVASRAAQHAELISMVVVIAARLCCSQLWIRGVDYGHQIQKCTPFVFQTQSDALFSRSDVVLALQTIRHIESPQVDALIAIADGCVYAMAEMNAIVDRSRFPVQFSSLFVNFCQVTLQICPAVSKHTTTKINRM